MDDCGLRISIPAAISVTDSLFQRGQHYQQFRPTYPDTLFEWLSAQSPAPHVAVDVGCGSGQASRGLEPHFQHVIGTDISLPQLQAAPASASAFLAAQAHQLPLPDTCVDLIIVAQAFHWFDKAAFFTEVERVLKPGGVLALISYGLCDVEGLEGMVRAFHDGPLGPWWPAERADVVAGYPHAQLHWPSLRFADTTIKREWSVEAFIGYLDTWSALAQAAKAGKSPLAPFSDALRKQWGPDTRTVNWPLRVRAWRKPGAR